ncbi:MAG: hypothetical protein L0Y58_02355 [Verrucomicrobia subdivision 3 bacterium]|nr:hypothetical protein [Limisphaerales bacterium]
MFNSTQGSARERLNKDQAELLRHRRALIINDSRILSQFFDGKFLTANDLTREQNYFLSRQADLGQASGGGIVHGLLVTEGATAGSIIIHPGHGITAAGELVLLDEELTINLADIASIQQLNARLGLSPLPSEPLRTRSGLFIVALRPIEFTDNPIASYPTSITGTRTVEDSDIVEAVVVTLIPYADRGGNADAGQRRAAVARELFVERGRRGVPENALPLAMIALERRFVRWIDPYLVRREAGAVHTNFFGVGQAPRALREAHLIQYQQHLRDVLEERGENARITAAEHFRALPPAGPMPIGSVNLDDFTQSYFPVEMDVQLTVVPSDELAAVIEESLALPPIDLTLGGDEHETTSVLALLPVERRDWQAIRTSLSPVVRQLRPVVPGLVAIRKPIQALQLLKPVGFIPVANPGAIVDQNWRNAFGHVVSLLDGFRTLWYVRRRNTEITSPFAGVTVIPRDDEGNERDLNDRMKDFGLQPSLTRLRSRATAEAGAGIVALLSSSKLVPSRLLLAGALEELGEEKTLDQSAVLRVANRFDHPKLGEGMRRLEEALPALKKDSPLTKRLAGIGNLPELDRLARLLPDDELRELAKQIEAAAKEKSATKLKRLLERRIGEMPS